MWEYHAFVTYIRHPYLEDLNSFGKDGWEVISVKQLADDNLLFIFKRRVDTPR
jgi:hypothetical protein